MIFPFALNRQGSRSLGPPLFTSARHLAGYSLARRKVLGKLQGKERHLLRLAAEGALKGALAPHAGTAAHSLICQTWSVKQACPHFTIRVYTALRPATPLLRDDDGALRFGSTADTDRQYERYTFQQEQHRVSRPPWQISLHIDTLSRCSRDTAVRVDTTFNTTRASHLHAQMIAT